MLEESLEDPSIEALSHKLRVMSIYGDHEDVLVKGLQRLSVHPTIPAPLEVERPRESKHKRHERYVLTGSIQLNTARPFYTTSTFEDLARLARTKK